MNVFAYIGILDVILKLLIVYLLTATPYDKLIVYAILLVAVSFIIQTVCGLYCKKQFEECRFKRVFNKLMLKEMMGFAGWNLLGSASTVLNNQGVNVIINIFLALL